MAKYQGREVELNKPTRGDVKKFKVFVKDPKTDNVKKVNFGSKEMEIKRDDPEKRKSFRARHKCDTAKDKTSARYWSCKMWGKNKVSDLVSSLVFDPGEVMNEEVQSSAQLDEAVALGLIKKYLVQNDVDFKDIFQKSGKVFISFFREKIADKALKVLKAYGFGDFQKRLINNVVVLASESPIEESVDSLVFEDDEEIDPDFITFDFPSITNFETTGYGGIKAVLEGELIDSDNDKSYPITVAIQGYYQSKEPDVGIFSSGFVASRIDVIDNPTSISDEVIEDKLSEYEFDFGSMSESVSRISESDFEKAFKNYGNRLKGGLGDKADLSQFDRKELGMGFNVEFEHTKDPELAMEIAADHLMEIPDYYTRLRQLERDAGVE